MISVIIPAHNVEGYISACIRSVLTQTHQDFELIIVNDGSTDSTGEICDYFKHSDDRIKVIHQDNAGVSRARNVGLQTAKGDYVCFIDADDWISPLYLRSFFDAKGDKDADLIIQGLVEYENNSPNKRISFKSQTFDDMGLFLSEGLHLFRGPYCKLFSRSIIKKYNILFPSELSYGEDSIFYLRYLMYCKRIKTIAYSFYNYRKNIPNSLTSVARTPRAELDFIEQNEKLYDLLRSRVQGSIRLPEVITSIVTYKCIVNASVINENRGDIMKTLRRIRFSPLLKFKMVSTSHLKDWLFKELLLRAPLRAGVNFFL